MITISRLQFERFHRNSRAALRARAVAYVAAHVPQAGDVGAVVDAAFARADTLKLGEEAEVFKYLDLVIRFGSEFERPPERATIVAALQDDEPGWSRLNRVRMLLEGHDPARRESAFAVPPTAEVTDV